MKAHLIPGYEQILTKPIRPPKIFINPKNTNSKFKL